MLKYNDGSEPFTRNFRWFVFISFVTFVAELGQLAITDNANDNYSQVYYYPFDGRDGIQCFSTRFMDFIKSVPKAVQR